MLIRLIVPGEYARLEDLNASLDIVLVRHGIDQERRDDVRLIVEELASNVIEHGGDPHGRPQHELSVNIFVDGDRLELEFRDTGAPFDPTQEPEPDLDGDILDRAIGGLGVYLIRQLAEHVSYRRIDPYNVLHVSLRAPSKENTR